MRKSDQTYIASNSNLVVDPRSSDLSLATFLLFEKFLLNSLPLLGGTGLLKMSDLLIRVVDNT
jgi:hypothetical protein